jgi:hypothetical protein
MLLSSTSCRDTIPYPETNCGNTYAAATCLTIYALSILQDLYYTDEYTLLDGDKQASVQPEFGVKQGCPLSPLLFSIYLNDVDSLVEGVQGALTGNPNFAVPELLLADDLSLLSNVHEQLQTMLNRLRVCDRRKSLTVNAHKSEVMCFMSRSDNRLPPLSYDGTQLSYTDTFKYLGTVRDKNINLNTAADAALRPFAAGTF